jgi:quinolinate synthase
VLHIADYIGSTNGMIKFTKTDPCQKYIIASETGILYQMKKESPTKSFLVVPSNETCSCNDCPYMKLNTLEKLYLCLKNETPEINIDVDVMEKAREPIVRMLSISRKLGLV